MSHDTETRLSVAMIGITEGRQYTPDFDQIESRGRKIRQRRLAWRAGAGGSFAVAAVAAVAVAVSGTGVQAPAPNLAAPNPATADAAGGTPLMQLVGNLTTAKAPAGDATLVLRHHVRPDGSKVDAWDLNADNGTFYFTNNRNNLPAMVRNKKVLSDTRGFKQVVAAAEYAAKGDLDKGRSLMALAYFAVGAKDKPPVLAPGVKPKFKAGSEKNGVNTTDNAVWINAMDAFEYGAGSPTVRAGVLRLLGQMPEVVVKKTTFKGEPVLTLAAGRLATGGGTQTLTVNAETGLPIRYASDGGVTIDYTVTRVTVADVAAGKF